MIKIAMIIFTVVSVPSVKNATPEAVVNKPAAAIIENVSSLAWGRNGDCTYAGALEAALAVTEHPVSYSDIMGYSGLAFRVRWRGHDKLGFCPSIPVGEFPEELEMTSKGTGWSWNHYEDMAHEKDPHMERYTDQIKASIDAKVPVIGYPKIGDLNVAVCYGYNIKDGTTSFLWHGYFSGEEPMVVPDKQTGPWVLIPAKHDPKGSEKERVLDALRHAVKNWKRTNPEKKSEPYSYTYGKEALDLWVNDLTNAASMTLDNQKGLFFANWWNYETLTDALKNAVPFLESKRALFPEEKQAQLDKAIALFKEETDVIFPAFHDENLFQGPWKKKQFEDWTPEIRAKEADVLTRARDVEVKAMAALEAL